MFLNKHLSLILGFTILSIYVPTNEELRRARYPDQVLASFDESSSWHNTVEMTADYWPTSPDVTAVILNWSRLPNVILIASLLCRVHVANIIAQVVVWNNNPRFRLSAHTFRNSNCPPGKLNIVNSPRNKYFAARFTACASATTSFCFLQDDDYLIGPNLIRTLRLSTSSKQDFRGIHLLPAAEMFSSRMRTLFSTDGIYHTAFAWLGYGSLILRSQAQTLLDELVLVNATSEEISMADNFYSILNNEAPELWFDQTIELGMGHPFTVGAEGDDRNWRHIESARVYLIENVQRIASVRNLASEMLSPDLYDVWRAACRTFICLLSSNILLLPLITSDDSFLHNPLRDIERTRIRNLSPEFEQTFLNHPLSFAVDGDVNSHFKSPQAGRTGEYITMDLQHEVKGFDVFVSLASSKSSDNGIESMGWEFSLNGADWSPATIVNCTWSDPRTSECRSEASRSWRFFRMHLQNDSKDPWIVNEITLSSSRKQ